MRAMRAEGTCEAGPACDVPWCTQPASVVWYRTAAERKAMQVRAKGSTVMVQPERRVCGVHMPEWRADVYVPIGQARPQPQEGKGRKRGGVAEARAELAEVARREALLRGALDFLARQSAEPHAAAWAREALAQVGGAAGGAQ